MGYEQELRDMQLVQFKGANEWPLSLEAHWICSILASQVADAGPGYLGRKLRDMETEARRWTLNESNSCCQ